MTEGLVVDLSEHGDNTGNSGQSSRGAEGGGTSSDDRRGNGRGDTEVRMLVNEFFLEICEKNAQSKTHVALPAPAAPVV